MLCIETGNVSRSLLSCLYKMGNAMCILSIYKMGNAMCILSIHWCTKPAFAWTPEEGSPNIYLQTVICSVSNSSVLIDEIWLLSCPQYNSLTESSFWIIFRNSISHNLIAYSAFTLMTLTLSVSTFTARPLNYALVFNTTTMHIRG